MRFHTYIKIYFYSTYRGANSRNVSAGPISASYAIFSISQLFLHIVPARPGRKFPVKQRTDIGQGHTLVERPYYLLDLIIIGRPEPCDHTSPSPPLHPAWSLVATHVPTPTPTHQLWEGTARAPAHPCCMYCTQWWAGPRQGILGLYI